MRGEVLHYDESQGFGFITGADGRQYTLRREDLRQPTPLVRGAVVEFQPSGGSAKLVRAPQASAASLPPEMPGIGSAPGSETFAGKVTEPTLLDPVPTTIQRPSVPVVPQQIARQSLASTVRAQHAPEPPSYGASAGTSVWDYFWRGLTVNYVNFEGRARRKEYWGFVLFSSIAFFALLVIGIAIDLGTWSFTWNDPTFIFCWALPGLWILATILPGLAVTVRRQHDIGISGWFCLLILLPSIGPLIILVFALIPSQKHDNKWGPMPPGVRLLPYATPAIAA